MMLTSLTEQADQSAMARMEIAAVVMIVSFVLILWAWAASRGETRPRKLQLLPVILVLIIVFVVAFIQVILGYRVADSAEGEGETQVTVSFSDYLDHDDLALVQNNQRFELNNSASKGGTP